MKKWFTLDSKLSTEVLHLALPVVAGLASITAIGLTDTIMVGRLGATALAATGQAVMVFWTVNWVLRSVELATQAISARRFGEGQLPACGEVLHHALVFSLTLSFFSMIVLYSMAPRLTRWISANEEVASLATGYIRVLFATLWLSGMFFALRGFFSGIGRTRVFLMSAGILFTANLCGNYMFIYGHWGAPAMGVSGAAVGSALSMICGFSFLILYTFWHRKKTLAAYELFSGTKWRWELIGEIARLAWPNMFRGVMVIGGLLVFYAMVDRVGVAQAAVVNLVINIQSVSFMPGYGFGIAAATMIGHSLGAGNTERAERAGYEAMKLGIIFMGSVGVLFLVAPEWVVRVFTDDEEVMKYAIGPLRLVGIVQIVDAAGMVLSTALEGAGQTRWVMMMEILVNWGVFLPLTYLLTFTLNMRNYGPWIAWGVYITLFGVISFIKFNRGSWKHVRL
ncbi:MAG TPA: MATE family efflux transporter [bacterium]|nr:MATE family efflux transporter [bacterium]